jgi:hypothetical protein
MGIAIPILGGYPHEQIATSRLAFPIAFEKRTLERVFHYGRYFVDRVHGHSNALGRK